MNNAGLIVLAVLFAIVFIPFCPLYYIHSQKKWHKNKSIHLIDGE